MRFWQPHELQTRPLNELFNYLDELKKQTKQYKLLYKEVDELLLELDEIDFEEHLAKLFESDHEKGEYVFPFAEQQKKYNGEKFLEHDILPAKGFFWRFEIIKKEFPFGLVEVTFQMQKVGLASDMKHWGENRVFKEDYKYYYDYENKRYVHVNMKRDSEEKTTYQERKMLYMHLRLRLEKENQTYLRLLEEAAIELTEQKFIFERKTENLRKKFFRFIQQTNMLKKYLPIKIIFNQIDTEHLKHINIHLDQLLKDAEECLEYLRKYEEKGYNDVLGDSFSRDITYKDLHESLETKKILETRDKIAEMFRMKNPSAVETRPMDGYFDYDDNRLYENIVQIEIEQARQLHSETRTSRRIEKENLLEKLKKKKS